MSAFVGILHTDGRPADAGQLRPALDLLQRIGPHGHGVFAAGSVAFGDVRLKTFDAPGSGMAFFEGGGVSLAGDVCLCRRDELIRSLADTDSPPPRDASDLQLLHCAWRQWGESTLERISGEFSFVGWDQATRHLFAARDQLGVRPFYYHAGRDTFFFSNALNSFHRLPGINPTPGRRAMADYLMFGFSEDMEATGFEQVRQLAPGHCLDVRDGRLSIRRYWEMQPAEPLTGLSDNALRERFSTKVARAVADRLGPGPVNIPFSGGMDSGTVAAMARRYYAEHQREGCISLLHGSVVSEDDDANIAVLRGFAEGIGARFELHRLDHENYYAQEFGSDWPSPDVSWYHDRVVADQHLASLARFAPVALTGQGGDAIFMQNYHYMEGLRRRGPRVLYLRELAAYYRMHGARPPLGLGLRGALAQRYAPTGDAGLPIWFDAKQAGELGLAERFNERSASTGKDFTFNDHPRKEFVSTIHSPFWQYVLGGHHPQATGWPLEFRHPFFDLHLLCLMASVTAPKWFREKALLRQTMQEHLPEQLLTRPKQVASATTAKADVLDALQVRKGLGSLGDNCVADLLDTSVFAGLMRQATRVSAAEMMSLSRVLIANDWCNSLESVLRD